MQYKEEAKQYPLVVDLDGTLIATDILYEGCILLLKKNLFYFFSFLQWIFKGKAFFKLMLLKNVRVRTDLLPYNIEVLEFLRAEFKEGRNLILMTASPLFYAQEIAETLGIFKKVYGTTDAVNLKGEKKLEILKTEFGEGQFDYIGNSIDDLVIFSSSRNSYLVNPSRKLKRKAERRASIRHIWLEKRNKFISYLKAIRIYQWIKNILLFVPLVTSHTFQSLISVIEIIQAFFAFSFVASAGYLINDLFDLSPDRIHPRKKFRPIASGSISILSGFLLATILLITGLAWGFLLGINFFIILFSYFLLSFFYSQVFKKAILYDIFTLAVLYSIRVFAGAVVSNVSLSFWLIAFSTFLFLSLAYVKRCSEIIKTNSQENHEIEGRGYWSADLIVLEIMGIASGFISIVVFSLYINSNEVVQLYSKPRLLWLISFLFLFWINRIWFYTIRGKMTDDPIVFASKDITSYFIFFVVIIVILISM